MLASIIEIGQSPAFILESFFYALIGGLFPALVWLWFWMHEGHEHHEPKGTIWLTFILGMCAVFLVYPFQQLGMVWSGAQDGSLTLIIIWAAIEEVAKFAVAYFIALRFKETVYDEPIDAFVYLVTAALGFSAMENTFFLLGPLLQGQALVTIVTDNMRFMGANLLHVASSGILSVFLALAYFKKRWVAVLYTCAGLFVAVLLHAVFNFLIIVITEVEKEKIFIAFSFVWITIIILILALERVKTIKKF